VECIGSDMTIDRLDTLGSSCLHLVTCTHSQCRVRWSYVKSGKILWGGRNSRRRNHQRFTRAQRSRVSSKCIQSIYSAQSRVSRLNVPQVFARDVGTTAPAEVVKLGEVNGPVRLQSEDQEAVINPGDIIIADLNGVVCIPQSLAEKVVDLIPSQVEADEKVAADIWKGRTVAESMKEHRAKVKQP